MDVKGVRSNLEAKQGKIKFSQKMRMKLNHMRNEQSEKIKELEKKDVTKKKKR